MLVLIIPVNFILSYLQTVTAKNMTNAHIIATRLTNQQVAKTSITKPVEIVSWLGAMQAQEYAMAKWAIGLRVPGLNDADVEQTFNDGKILRTHVLRPTWHFVAPADIRWMLALTAPRINALSAYYYRQQKLDSRVFKKANKAIIKALEGGNYLTRVALQDALQKAKIEADGVRLAHILMQAELEGIICSGPRYGKQFTYALIEERVPATKKLAKQEALIELTMRYFTSRGPATLKDFANWSGLAMSDVKNGAALLGKKLEKETINDNEYFFASSTPLQPNKLPSKLQSTFLMPDYDEYGISYKDRSAIFGEKKSTANTKKENPVFYHALIVDGVSAGSWKKVVEKNKTDVEITLVQKLSKVKQQAVAKAVKKYLKFVGE